VAVGGNMAENKSVFLFWLFIDYTLNLFSLDSNTISKLMVG
jgi:hypothetical protein